MIEHINVEGEFWQAPYSHACRAGNFLYVTGQMPIDPATGEYVAAEIEVQSRRVMDNLRIVLKHAGMSEKDVVSARVFLADIADYDVFNRVYSEYLTVPRPARTCIAVSGLAGGALVEVDLVAYRD
ncbi:RidA family protein [Amycolatopsis jejuensis]|uniref:RidA family protein n=1 Tax=Amycolatopsis jejuensis TaxID=330084 RepID=UPI0005254123|nr:Rid family detoxifying hydrolase [Amycolatopsis jejuensis]